MVNANLKVVLAAIFLILLLGVPFFFALREDTEVLIVHVTLARPIDGNMGNIISQVSASIAHVRKMEVPEESLLAKPGITVIVMQNMKEISGWYSIPVPTNESIYGNYTLKVKPFDKIDRTMPISILARVVDPDGKDVSAKAVVTKIE